jgi:hypothetical protein
MVKLNEQILRIKTMMGLNENNILQSALKKMDNGIPYSYLDAKERMSLDIMVNHTENIDLHKFYRDRGNTFGHVDTKVRVKSVGDQMISSERDRKNAGRIGWLMPYYNIEDDTNRPWVTVWTEDKIEDKRNIMGYYYDTINVYLHNLELIEVGDQNTKYFEYDLEKKRKEGFWIKNKMGKNNTDETNT